MKNNIEREETFKEAAETVEKQNLGIASFGWPPLTFYFLLVTTSSWSELDFRLLHLLIFICKLAQSLRRMDVTPSFYFIYFYVSAKVWLKKKNSEYRVYRFFFFKLLTRYHKKTKRTKLS